MPTILHRDGGLWVFNKPSGWATHSTAQRGSDEAPEAPDVLTWARANGAAESLAPVHRLDLPTSGVLICAEDERLRAELGAYFADGKTEKTYLCLVHGRLRKKGIIRRPLPDARRKRPVEAVTRYRCLEWLGKTSFVSVRPETGRKHQIRRHLTGLGHPIVGDDRHGPKRYIPVPGFPGRLWLHAAELKLGEALHFSAPLPKELEDHLQLLRDRQTNKAAKTPDEAP